MLFFALSALAVIALMFCVVSVRSMYDVTPNTWGPPGVAFAEWHDAWRARRNLYLWLTVVSLFASVVFALGRAVSTFTPHSPPNRWIGTRVDCGRMNDESDLPIHHFRFIVV